MDSNFTEYWTGRIRSSFENSQWEDSAAQAFESTYLSRVTAALNGLSDTGEKIHSLIRKTEPSLH